MMRTAKSRSTSDGAETPRHDALRRLLIERRQRAGLTQTELAERLGSNQRYV
jgi:DNA-binding XRE family transcriptional regulator